MNVFHVLQLCYSYLKERQVLEPKSSSQQIVAHVLGVSKSDLFLHSDRTITQEEYNFIETLMKRRGKGEPIEYVFEKIMFYHCLIFLNREVLIPRQETEILVDLVVKHLEKEDRKDKNLWDLCCGSGCIGIALKKRFTDLQVTLSDISSKAIFLAEKNGRINQVDIRLKQGDLLTPFQNEKADFIVCNPPYVSEEEYLFLDREVKDFEPRRALVAGPLGLEFYERLAKTLPAFLNKGAKIFFEIGEKQASFIEKIFMDSWWKNKQILIDFAGKSRFFSLEFE